MYIGEYRCEVEWSNEKEPFQVTHSLEVLVSPKVKFVPSTRASSSTTGYSKTGKLILLCPIRYYHRHIRYR